MFRKQTSLESIRRILKHGFSVRDIAEPLYSFAETTDAGAARKVMERLDFDVAGLRRNGLVLGFISRNDLEQGTCGDFRREFDENEVMSDATGFEDLVIKLSNRSSVFVTVFGAVGGIVTHRDLEKPPVRMWLFGMITIMEMRFVRMIEHHCPNDEWKIYLSPGRIEKAETLLHERTRRGVRARLIDCLQLSDKSQIVIRNEAIRNVTQLPSRRRAERLFKQLESLRNHLAHSQDLVETDWETIVLLANNLDRVISGPPGQTDLLEGPIDE